MSAQFDHTTHEERPRIVSLPALQVRWMRREGARAKGEAEGTREGSSGGGGGGGGACIGSLCLRQCVHGAPIGGGGHDSQA
jgi:hypothetical protein